VCYCKGQETRTYLVEDQTEQRILHAKGEVLAEEHIRLAS
jgi:hypothetical protein